WLKEIFQMNQKYKVYIMNQKHEVNHIKHHHFFKKEELAELVKIKNEHCAVLIEQASLLTLDNYQDKEYYFQLFNQLKKKNWIIVLGYQYSKEIPYNYFTLADSRISLGNTKLSELQHFFEHRITNEIRDINSGYIEKEDLFRFVYPKFAGE
ncbi:MAG: hypothetical protein IJ875_05800, partial [Solobacterium sp.]|nr:hypothetical protein [Solobacterium sp.]